MLRIALMICIRPSEAMQLKYVPDNFNTLMIITTFLLSLMPHNGVTLTVLYGR